MKYVSKENAIPEAYRQEIEDLLFSRGFPWEVVHEKFANNNGYSLGFSHLALNDGPINPKGSTATNICPSLLPLAYTMGDVLGKKIEKILRIRVGLLVPSVNVDQGLDFVDYTIGGDDAHLDFMIPHYTGLYYVNDSDGDTVIFNETEQSSEYTELVRSAPERGKIFIFDGLQYHCSSKPKKSYARAVITINFTVEDE